MSAATTVTYFMQSVDGGPIKIGRSTTRAGVTARLNGCQTGNPHRLHVTKVLEGDHERSLHERFSAARLAGEWFRPIPELVALAEGLPDPDTAVDSLSYLRGYDEGWAACVDLMRERAASVVEDHVASLTAAIDKDFKSSAIDVAWDAQQSRRPRHTKLHTVEREAA